MPQLNEPTGSLGTTSPIRVQSAAPGPGYCRSMSCSPLTVPRRGESLAAASLEAAPAGTARAFPYDVQGRSLAMSAAASFIDLGDGEQAEANASTDLQLFSDVPEHDRWVAGELTTHHRRTVDDVPSLADGRLFGIR